MGEIMKRPALKGKKETSDPFTLFKKGTAKAFAFLITDYGFTHVDTTVHRPECVIRYRNETTGVTVSYEWGGTPSVILSRLNRTATDVSEADEIGLKFLAMERCPNGALAGDYERLKSQSIEEVLSDYAAILRECGTDILTGDFQIFAKLRKLVEAEQRKVNLEMFGSETGETRKRAH
jgi:hypothetical protein